MRAWRLTRAEFAEQPLSGVGASLVGGRWNSAGRELLYAADSIASAVLEVLVHLEGWIPEGQYVAVELQIDDDIGLTRLAPAELPTGWDEIPPVASVGFGDTWLDRAEAVGLVVPSVVVRGHSNILLNPAHADFARIVVVDQQPFVFDRRLLLRPLHRP